MNISFETLESRNLLSSAGSLPYEPSLLQTVPPVESRVYNPDFTRLPTAPYSPPLINPKLIITPPPRLTPPAPIHLEDILDNILEDELEK